MKFIQNCRFYICICGGFYEKDANGPFGVTINQFYNSLCRIANEVIRHPDGSATINQWDPDDGYSYSEDVPANREIIIPRKKIIMTPEEADELRNSYVNDAVRSWQEKNVIINVNESKDEQKKSTNKK